MSPEAPENSSQAEARIREILQPLLHDNASNDYLYHFKSMLDFDHCLRQVESSYAQAYARLVNTEKEIALHRNHS